MAIPEARERRMTPSTLALARRVRALLEAPERWTQGAIACDGDGEMVSAHARTAVCWCMIGAINRCAARARASVDVNLELRRLLEKARGGTEPLDFWNDAPGRTHADVLALLDRVIAEGER